MRNRSFHDSPPRDIVDRLIRGSAIACFALGVFFAAKALWWTEPSPASSALPMTATGIDPASDTTYRKIQDMQLGQRVVGKNPLRDEVDKTLQEPDEATWRALTLTMTKPDGKRLDIGLLRPVSWIEARQAEVGQTIQLDLEELGAKGSAEVLAIEPCPPIEPPPGEVVTGTFAHESSHHVLDISIEGETKPIGVTSNHPFWSVDRNEFVPAGELRIGETLDTLGGHTKVTSISARGPPELVYNLEVHGEHVYRVAESGVLVHNAYDVALGLTRGRNGEPLLSRLAGDAITNEHWVARNLADDGPFVKRFYQALYRTVNRGGRIRIHTDDLNIDQVLETPRFSDPFEAPGGGTRVTNWEIQQVLNNRKFYDAADFYLDGVKLTTDEVLELGLFYRGR